jgi:hypothetical protein
MRRTKAAGCSGLLVDVSWVYANLDGGSAWRRSRVIYAYLHARTRNILYLGKAWGTTVRERWNARDKRGGVWSFLDAAEIREHVVIVGELSCGVRLTSKLLADVESLLIAALQPPANVASVASRRARPGLRVRAHGDAWPGPELVIDAM